MEHVIQILQKLLAGTATVSEVQEIKQAITSGDLSLATGKRSVAIGGSADGAVIHTGDFKIVLTAEALTLLTRTPYAPSPPKNLDETHPPASLPPGSRLEFSRNQVFTGREEDLIMLAKKFFMQKGTALVTQSITGIGGIGKTQLAVEFCCRYGRYFHGVHWIDAANPTPDEDQQSASLLSKVEGEIAQCGEVMHPSTWPHERPDQVRQTLNTWAASGPRLVVLDNLEDVAAAREIIQLLGVGGDLRILVTARRSNWPDDLIGECHQLGVFKPEESLSFLRKKLKSEQKYLDGEIATLAKKLGHLPLALELAGRYIALTQRLRIEGYLEEFEAILAHPSMQNWKPDYGSPTGHDLSLHGTFLISWQALVREETRQVFRIIAWCAPNQPIPHEILLRATELEENAYDQALRQLENAGLITCQGIDATPVVHPLLAEFGQGESLSAVELADQEKLAGALTKITYQVNTSGYPREFEPLREHVEEIAGHAELKGLQDAGVLWGDLGYHLDMIADYRGAREYYQRSLAILEPHFGENHPEVGKLVNNLGSVLQSNGEFLGAKNYFERSLKIFEKHWGENDPDVGTLVNNLGIVLQDMGDSPGAKAYFERALKIDEAAFGPDHPNVAADVNNLGSVLQGMEDYPAAKEMYQRSLAILEPYFGENHPEVGKVVNNLGGVMQDMGDYPAAKAYFERALAILEPHFGENHPEVGKVVNNLGSVLHDMGDLLGAKEMYQRALIIFKDVLSENHRDIIAVQNTLEKFS